MLPTELEQKLNGDLQRRSEADRHRYWSKFKRLVVCQVPAPRRKNQVCLRVGGCHRAPRRWWHERLQTHMPVGDEGSPTHPLISEEGKV